MPQRHAPSAQESWQLLDERMRQDLVIPYLGAGISQQLPAWDKLLDALEGPAQASPGEKQPSLPVRADILGLEHGDALVDEIVGRFRPAIEAFEVAGSTHQRLIQGDWPALLTTNWDPFLEMAWADRPRRSEASKAQALPVRYRADASRFLAELQAGAWPGPLMKLHGDLSERGRPEFVFTYTQYRRLIQREVELQAIFQYLLTHYSLLFHGTSLTDTDLLGFMDDAQERLGHVAGPHFWLTADKLSPGHRRFLFQRYAIHVIDAPTRRRRGNPWGLLLEELLERRLAARGRGPQGAGAERFELSLGSLSVALRAERFEAAQVAQARDSAEEAIVASVWPVAGRLPAPRVGGTWALIHEAFVGAGGQVEGLEIEEGRALRLSGGLWVVAGQRNEGYATPWLVHRAVVDLVRQVSAAGYSVLRMSLPGTGRSGLPRKLVMDAVLHALGAAAPSGQALRVELHVPPEPRDPFSPNLTADAADGRMNLAAPVRRGRAGLRLVHVVYPAKDLRERGFHELASALLDRDATLTGLVSRLPGLPPELGPEQLLLCLPESLSNRDHPDAKQQRPLSDITDQLIVTLKAR